MIVWVFTLLTSCITAGVALAGTIALGKHLGRVVRTRRETEFMALFSSNLLPDPGQEVEALIDFRMGQRTIIRACHWPHIGWVEIATLLPVPERVIGWRGLDPDRPGFPLGETLSHAFGENAL